MKIGFITIPVHSMDESIQFYEQVIGLKLFKRFNPDEGTEIAFMSDGHEGVIELIHGAGFPPGSECSVSIGFNVDDIDETHEHLKKHGVKITSGPIRLPTKTQILHAEDPNGVNLGFVHVEA